MELVTDRNDRHELWLGAQSNDAPYPGCNRIQDIEMSEKNVVSPKSDGQQEQDGSGQIHNAGMSKHSFNCQSAPQETANSNKSGPTENHPQNDGNARV